MTFTRIVAPLRRTRVKATLAVSWHAGGQGAYDGRVSSAALRLIESWESTEPLGVVTYAGDGEDEGRFALDFVPLSTNPAAVPLHSYEYLKGGAKFAGGALSALKPSGKSLLEHIPGTTMLTGWVEGHEPPGSQQVKIRSPRSRASG